MVRVSVVVPIYNVEPYIDRCVRSLMEQTIEEIEYIFVDDCGSDDSMEILMAVLRDYPQKQPFITIIHNAENLGLSLSRKVGFESSHGEYLITCDADDWVEPNAYQELYDCAQLNKADIVVCDYIKETITQSEKWHFYLAKDSHRCLASIHDNHRFSWTIWNQLIRRDIMLQAIQNVFPTTYAEDIYTMIHVYWLSKIVAHVSSPLYHYNQCNAQSVMISRRWAFGDWNVQQQNIDYIVAMLDPAHHPDYILACQWLKFKVKEKMQSTFPNLRLYYRTYKESHRDILRYEYIPVNVRHKLFIIYSCYPTFWLYNQLEKYRNYQV